MYEILIQYIFSIFVLFSTVILVFNGCGSSKPAVDVVENKTKTVNSRKENDVKRTADLQLDGKQSNRTIETIKSPSVAMPEQKTEELVQTTQINNEISESESESETESEIDLPTQSPTARTPTPTPPIIQQTVIPVRAAAATVATTPINYQIDFKFKDWETNLQIQ